MIPKVDETVGGEAGSGGIRPVTRGAKVGEQPGSMEFVGPTGMGVIHPNRRIWQGNGSRVMDWSPPTRREGLQVGDDGLDFGFGEGEEGGHGSSGDAPADGALEVADGGEETAGSGSVLEDSRGEPARPGDHFRGHFALSIAPSTMTDETMALVDMATGPNGLVSGFRPGGDDVGQRICEERTAAEDKERNNERAEPGKHGTGVTSLEGNVHTGIAGSRPRNRQQLSMATTRSAAKARTSSSVVSQEHIRRHPPSPMKL